MHFIPQVISEMIPGMYWWKFWVLFILIFQYDSVFSKELEELDGNGVIKNYDQFQHFNKEVGMDIHRYDVALSQAKHILQNYPADDYLYFSLGRNQSVVNSFLRVLRPGAAHVAPISFSGKFAEYQKLILEDLRISIGEFNARTGTVKKILIYRNLWGGRTLEPLVESLNSIAEFLPNEIEYLWFSENAELRGTEALLGKQEIRVANDIVDMFIDMDSRPHFPDIVQIDNRRNNVPKLWRLMKERRVVSRTKALQAIFYFLHWKGQVPEEKYRCKLSLR